MLSEDGKTDVEGNGQAEIAKQNSWQQAKYVKLYILTYPRLSRVNS